MNDPERLLDAGASPLERRLLDAAARERPPLELVQGMQTGLGLGGKAGATASAAGGGLGVAGSVAVAVLGLGAMLAGYAALPSTTESQPVPAQSTRAAVVVAPVPSPVEPEPAVPAVAAAQTSEPAPAPKKVSAAAKSNAGDALRQELELLDEARSALKGGAPARARSLLDRHARRFPKGSFRQEADVLRVEALERLGERQKAASLAREFLSEYPESPHVERVGKAANSSR